MLRTHHPSSCQTAGSSQLRVGLAFACCIASTQARAQSGSAPPDVVMLGGKVFTSDSTHPCAQALAIRGDRIIAVGSTRSILALSRASTRTIDLAGHLVIPG